MAVQMAALAPVIGDAVPGVEFQSAGNAHVGMAVREGSGKLWQGAGL
jgi:hypothetical protein